MAWKNTPASDSLLAEFNTAFPARAKSSDGTIGDGEHATGISDHNPDETGNTGSISDADTINEVHARDISVTLNRPGWTMERCVQLILARCRAGTEKRLRYVIFNGRIWSSSSGWVQREYNGANPHDKHAHFSFLYGSGSGQSNPENITSPWGILAAMAPPKGWDEMATQAELEASVEKAVLKVLNTAHKLVPSPVAARVHDGLGWGPMTDREIISRLFEKQLGIERMLMAMAKTIDASISADDVEDAKVIGALAEMKELLAKLVAPEGEAPEDPPAAR